ncbi:hypothetical protein THAOC_24781 [Thalassiosira oceanica]|uniref:Uncharacterized protein n=1 Tax=Thalassiosira oceanica TaxID=159749 RepID=K0S3A9_THAOC|nr:hypothetical protein THAOC_24781 [Thalassiosira oceanica]|eukprot:EJK55486.1 hypothetical protein THAOC_24781 [Thalassiosira oceanica]
MHLLIQEIWSNVFRDLPYGIEFPWVLGCPQFGAPPGRTTPSPQLSTMDVGGPYPLADLTPSPRYLPSAKVHIPRISLGSVDEGHVAQNFPDRRRPVIGSEGHPDIAYARGCRLHTLSEDAAARSGHDADAGERALMAGIKSEQVSGNERRCRATDRRKGYSSASLCDIGSRERRGKVPIFYVRLLHKELNYGKAEWSGGRCAGGRAGGRRRPGSALSVRRDATGSGMLDTPEEAIKAGPHGDTRAGNGPSTVAMGRGEWTWPGGGGSDDHGLGGDLRKARICYFAQSDGSTHRASGFKSRELNPT